MPRFVPTDSIIDALCFDGSPDSAMSVAKAFGKTVTVSIDGEAVRLTLAKRAVPAGSWIGRVGKRFRVFAAEAFAKSYEPLPSATSPFIEKMRAEATPSVTLPPRGFLDGDIVRIVGRPEAEEYEVLDAKADVLECDSVWGQETFPIDAATLIRRP